MKAICTGCGIEIQFEPEKRGLMEKCSQCGEIFPLEPSKAAKAGKPAAEKKITIPARAYLRKVRAESNYDELRTLVAMIAWGLKGASVIAAVVVLLIVYQLYSAATSAIVEWAQTLALRGPMTSETAQRISQAHHITDLFCIMVGVFSITYILGFGFFLATVIHQSFLVGIDIADMSAEQGARSANIG